MFLDGVRADGARSELPVAPLSVEQTHTVMTTAHASDTHEGSAAPDSADA
jgi:hypothetical protein